MPLLEIKNLSIDLGEFKPVHGVDMCIDSGQFVSLLGPSGCGKTSLALSILQLQEHANLSGYILYQNQNLLELSETQMNTIRGADIAMIFQEPMTSLNPEQNVVLQIKESLILHNPKSTKKKILELLSMVELPKRVIKSYPHELSGGQRQRVMIAMALAGNPKLLIADEPTTALDSVTQIQILQLLLRLKKELNLAILFITHDVEIIKDITDAFYVMGSGKIIGHEAPKLPHLDKPIPLDKTNAHKILQVKDLTVKYNNFVAVQDFSFSLQQGETLGLVGQSGCGKSSVGLALTRLIEAKGEVLLNDVDFLKLKGKALFDARPKLQMVFQDPFSSLNPRMMVEDIISEGLKIHKIKNIPDRVQQIMKAVHLPIEIKNHYPHELSGGQRVRVALARALVLEPEVLILDEITTSLDIHTQRIIIELLKELQNQLHTSYIFISHDMRILASIAHRVIEMSPRAE